MACAPGAVRPYCSSTTGIMLVKLIKVVPVSLTIASALGLLFSEKFTGYRKIGSHRVDSHIKPEFGT